MNSLQPGTAILPQTCRDHPLPNRLARKVNAVQLRELLRRQGRAKVRVTFPDNADGCSAQSRRVAAVARPTALPGNQGPGASLSVGLGQSKHLAPAKAHQRRGFRYFEPARSQILQHAHPVDLRPAHRNHRHRPKTPQPKPWRVSSLSGPKVTSLSGVYTDLPRIRCYGTSMSALPLDFVAKVENPTTPKISRKSILDIPI